MKDSSAPDITYPVRVEATAVYFAIYDSEDRLITFVGQSWNDRANAELIADLLNKNAA